MITLVNYGLGNVQAFVNIYKRLNIPVVIADSKEKLENAERIILPGVGAFDWAMTLLNDSGMRECLDNLVMVQKRPVLGICVGMQMMARRSDEGQLAGLGWIDAEVKKFDEATFTQKTHLPHMGWNDVLPKRADGIFKDMVAVPQFYFLHSYFFAPSNSCDVLATTDYGSSFASAVRLENVMGTQFHPEKSHQAGIQLLKNFAET